MKLISATLSLLVLLVALAFALSNRQVATISLWPFGAEVQAPLCLLTLGTFFLGLLMGAVFAWFNVLPHRLEARRLRKDLHNLHNKIDSLQQTVIPPHANEDDDTLALPQPKSRWPFQGTGS